MNFDLNLFFSLSLGRESGVRALGAYPIRSCFLPLPLGEGWGEGLSENAREFFSPIQNATRKKPQ
jgi:hypothetical protein